MARASSVTVVTAALATLACASPPQQSIMQSTVIEIARGSVSSDLFTGKWYAYLQKTTESDRYKAVSIEISHKTAEQIAVYKEEWLEHSMPPETREIFENVIDWSQVSLYGEIKSEINTTRSFLIEKLIETDTIRIILDDSTGIVTYKLYDGQLTVRRKDEFAYEMVFYRILPDYTQYSRCEEFDHFEPTSPPNLVGEWRSYKIPLQLLDSYFFNLKVSMKTTEEVEAYRVALRNTTVERTRINWSKVKLEAELEPFENTRPLHRLRGLIEVLDRPGSIRVIPLRDVWDRLNTVKINEWFETQNIIVKDVEGRLAIKNCASFMEKAYFSRSPGSVNINRV